MHHVFSEIFFVSGVQHSCLPCGAGLERRHALARVCRFTRERRDDMTNGPAADSVRTSFRGATCMPSLDRTRLSLQIERLRVYMLGVEWRSLREIKSALEDIYAPAVVPESSISAQLRNLKKPGYSYLLLKRRRAGVHGPSSGLWEYRLLPPGPKLQLGLFGQKQVAQPPAAVRVDDHGDSFRFNERLHAGRLGRERRTYDEGAAKSK